MGLIECVGCGRRISANAPDCIHCGALVPSAGAGATTWADDPPPDPWGVDDRQLGRTLPEIRDEASEPDFSQVVYLNPFQYWLRAWSRYGDFSGRARRAEFWWFSILNVFAVTAVVMLDIGLVESMGMGVPGFMTLGFVLASIIPTLSSTVRRLHDTGRSGWWWFLNFVPLGGLILFVMLCLDSEPGWNDYGPDPKYPS